jgi:hypothetical protein
MSDLIGFKASIQRHPTHFRVAYRSMFNLMLIFKAAIQPHPVASHSM